MPVSISKKQADGRIRNSLREWRRYGNAWEISFCDEEMGIQFETFDPKEPMRQQHWATSSRTQTYLWSPLGFGRHWILSWCEWISFVFLMNLATIESLQCMSEDFLFVLNRWLKNIKLSRELGCNDVVIENSILVRLEARATARNFKF